MGRVVALLFFAVIFVLVRRKWRSISLDDAGSSTTASATQTADLTTIINKVGRAMMSGKLDEALVVLNANVDRFSGADKAALLNQRGGVYTMKGKHEAALADNKLAYELEPTLTNLTNYIEALVKLGKNTEAKPLAEQALLNPNISSSDKKMLTGVLAAA